MNQKKIAYKSETQFLYLHKYLYGGATTFTAHLLCTLKQDERESNTVLRVGKRCEKVLKQFGYGLSYRNVSLEALSVIKRPFITILKDNYSYVLSKLNDGRKKLDDIVLVIHDYRDISHKSLPHIKRWKIVTIRKTVQEYLRKNHDLDTIFLYHPFHPYPTISKEPRRGAVSISRISFEKNIDVILKANSLLNSESKIKLYGCPSRMYVYLFLGGQRENFNKYYYGTFDKSFSSLSSLLSNVKFVVDLSVLKHDGGGTQYTFLEAIHNGCALILHRGWIENSNVRPEYSDFREDYNCFAVENDKELADLIRKDPDTSKVTENAKKLMNRHIKSDWSNLL
jgi:hypothetical protein